MGGHLLPLWTPHAICHTLSRQKRYELLFWFLLTIEITVIINQPISCCIAFAALAPKGAICRVLPFVYLSVLYPSLCPSVFLPIHLYVCPSLHLSIRLSVRPSMCLSVHLYQGGPEISENRKKHQMFLMGHRGPLPMTMTTCAVSKKQPWLKSYLDFSVKISWLNLYDLGVYSEIVLKDLTFFIEPLSQSVTRSCTSFRVSMLFILFSSLDICSTKFL
jgi:hypothetical protein